jgi:uncharacterized protein (DUF952 family)
MIFKIIARDAWNAACREGKFDGSPDDMRDGYIHFSAADQVRATAAKYYRGVEDLLLVAFEEAALGEALVWEPARGGALFPHLYAPLPTALARWQKPLALDVDGVPIISEDVVPKDHAP